MYWRSVGISLEIALRFLLLVAVLAAARHAIFPNETSAMLSDLNSPIGPLQIDETSTRPAVTIFLRNVSVMLFFALLVSLDYVRRTNTKWNPGVGRLRDRVWKWTLHTLFWILVAWLILRLTRAYIDLSFATGLPIWKLFISTLPYGAIGVCGVCMPIGAWMSSPDRSFKKTFRPIVLHAIETGALLIAAAAVLESVYRPELLNIWFQI